MELILNKTELSKWEIEDLAKEVLLEQKEQQVEFQFLKDKDGETFVRITIGKKVWEI